MIDDGLPFDDGLPEPSFIDYEPSEFGPGGKFDDSRPRFSGRALRAVVRNATADAGADAGGESFGPVTFDVVVSDPEGIEADGADFICALFWIMTAAGYEERTRSFVCAVVGHLDRAEASAGGCALVDEGLAEMLGCCPKTVQRKRGEYLDEEARLRFSVLEVDEGDFDHATGRNRPTRYKFLIGADVAAAVQLARGSALWERDSRGAIKAAAYKVFKDIDEAPPAARRRRKKARSIESEIEALRKTLKTKLAKLRDLERKRRKGDVARLWEGLRGELEEIINSPGFGQSVEAAGDDPRGGQTVHPSPASGGAPVEAAGPPAAAEFVPDIYVPAEVPNDEESIRSYYREQGYEFVDGEAESDEGREEKADGDCGGGPGGRPEARTGATAAIADGRGGGGHTLPEPEDRLQHGEPGPDPVPQGGRQAPLRGP